MTKLSGAVYSLFFVQREEACLVYFLSRLAPPIADTEVDVMYRRRLMLLLAKVLCHNYCIQIIKFFPSFP